MSIVGLDLAGVKHRPTGLCVLEHMQAETKLVFADDEVLEATTENKPKVIAIDAPLSLPSGRSSIEQRTNVHLRECDKELLRRGIKFFPVTLGPMRKLTARGIMIKNAFENDGLKVIEVYPGGAQDVLGIARKQQGLDRLRAALEEEGVKGLNSQMSDHELDAVTCALVGKLFLEGKTVTYRTPEQAIIMPRGRRAKRARVSKLLQRKNGCFDVCTASL